MSRVGKKPIKLVSGVKVNFKSPFIEVGGKGGKLSRAIPPYFDVEIMGDEVLVKLKSVALPENIGALHGLTRTIIQNMVLGVSEGFSKVLELRGVGYRAQTKGDDLSMSLGFSHPVDFPLPKGVTAKVEANTKIILQSADKELLGVTADKLRRIRPPECYKGKGIRYFNEQIKLKQGKAAVAGGSPGAGG